VQYSSEILVLVGSALPKKVPRKVPNGGINVKLHHKIFLDLVGIPEVRSIDSADLLHFVDA
jgi:hypothetical protein